MGKSNILIIDDDANLRKTLTGILKVKGYDAIIAPNGKEGLNLLRLNNANLIILDLILPDMSGIDVLKNIKAGNPDAETIILTGNASLNSAIEATNMGAFSYLLKPVDIDQLLLHIRHALEKQEAQEKIAAHNKEQESINLKLSIINADLEKEIKERKRAEEEKEKLIVELKEALSKIKTLTGMLPICANCKRIRNDKGVWEQVEIYIKSRSEAEFTHGICPDCARKLYPEFYNGK
ncbi:MAG: response regulator [Spirochaetota bacterium]